jgi:prefoldin subunit 5
VFLSGAVAAGQNKPDNPATLESLQREVRQLQEQVSGLQAQLAAQPVSAPPASLESTKPGVKVLKIEGKLPGEEGYPLH